MNVLLKIVWVDTVLECKFDAGGGQNFVELLVYNVFMEIELPQRKLRQMRVCHYHGNRQSSEGNAGTILGK